MGTGYFGKKYIFKNQTDKDTLILNYDDEIVNTFATEAKANIKYFADNYIKDCYVLNGNYISYNNKDILDTTKFYLKGKHNYLNVCASLNAIKEYINVSNEDLENIIKENINASFISSFFIPIFSAI